MFDVLPPKQLAIERKLTREIARDALEELNSQNAGYEIRKEFEFYPEWKRSYHKPDGYKVQFLLISSKPRDRIQERLTLAISTMGAHYLHKDESRVVIAVGGEVRCDVTKPRTYSFHGSTGQKIITFNRDRDRKHQVSAIVNLVNDQQGKYNDVLERVENDVWHWDAFDEKVNRVRRKLRIPKSKVWAPHANPHLISMDILRTSRRKVLTTIDLFAGDIQLRIDRLSEEQLTEIIGIIRK